MSSTQGEAGEKNFFQPNMKLKWVARNPESDENIFNTRNV